MTSDDPWYAIAAMTRTNTPVRVRWAWWTGTAVLLSTRPGALPRWVQPVAAGGGNRFLALPSSLQRVWRNSHAGDEATVTALWLAERGWGEHPDMWQPIGDWRGPLPEPLTVLPDAPRMVTLGRTTYSALEDAEAAAEDQENREAARARPKSEPRTETLPWWRTAAVTYSTAGQISERETEVRVMRALYFLSGPELPVRYRSNAAVLADMMVSRDWGKSDFSSPHVPRMLLTTSDTPDRLLAAMRWACELALVWPTGGRAVNILIRRARNEPETFDDIGARLKPAIPRQAAQQTYARAIVALTKIANAGTPTVDARLSALKDRDRAHAHTR